jgi:RHS repeat-associated protein
MQIMNGQTPPLKSLVALPGGGIAAYTATGLYYYHSDHLSSFRLASTSTRTVYFDLAYAPFGETYASSGTPDIAFTGQRQDTSAGLYDFPAREYSTQGRWASPDPAGRSAASPTNPQSWNRYAYAMNNPLALRDASGLDPCQGANNFAFSQAANGTGIFDQEDCIANGGTWGNSGTCMLDGAEVSCSLAVFTSPGGAAVQCPNNNCGPVSIGGVLAHFSAYLTGAGYVPYAGPGSAFDTNDQAMIAGAMYAENQSLLTNGSEQCGMTYAAGNGFSYTAPVEGTHAGCNPDVLGIIPAGYSADGSYHSHGIADPNYDNERFSGQPGDINSAGYVNGDAVWSSDYGLPLSLATPGGRVMIFYPLPWCQTFVLGTPFGTGTTIPICHQL